MLKGLALAGTALTLSAGAALSEDDHRSTQGAVLIIVAAQQCAAFRGDQNIVDQAIRYAISDLALAGRSPTDIDKIVNAAIAVGESPKPNPVACALFDRAAKSRSTKPAD